MNDVGLSPDRGTPPHNRVTEEPPPSSIVSTGSSNPSVRTYAGPQTKALRSFGVKVMDATSVDPVRDTLRTEQRFLNLRVEELLTASMGKKPLPKEPAA